MTPDDIDLNKAPDKHHFSIYDMFHRTWNIEKFWTREYKGRENAIVSKDGDKLFE